MYNTLIVSALCIGLSIGSVVTLTLTDVIGHIKRTISLKKCPEHEQELNTLSEDTQIILKQYMEHVDYYGTPTYIVRDIKEFDLFLRKHSLYNVANNGYCELNECIKNSLANGNGFIVWLNGEQYVAVQPPIHINPDCLVK